MWFRKRNKEKEEEFCPFSFIRTKYRLDDFEWGWVPVGTYAMKWADVYMRVNVK